MEKYKLQIAATLSNVLGHTVSPNELGHPPDRTLGDFAFPCFKLAKDEKKSPAEVAAAVLQKIAPHFSEEEIEVKTAGPYVNFSLSKKVITGNLLPEILKDKDRYAALPAKSRENWVFEFSSPNVAKPFQIYHLRTTIVGSSLSKIAKHRGYDVVTINHLGDWGTQYGKLAVALKRYANTLPAEITLKNLVDVYVQIHKDMETDSTIEKEGQAAFLKLEQGDPELRALWKKCVEISIKEFEKTYARFQVHFDHYWGESHYENLLKPLLQDLTAKGILVEDQGAKIVRVTTRDGKEIPPCILEKSDGASIYATRDVAAAIYRYNAFHFAKMSYVVGKEQKLHFEQVFGVLRAMGFAWEKNCEHIATGLYRFKDAKMSTRKGNFITLEEVNELCIDKALTLMRERNQTESEEQKLSEAELTKIADQVAVGAIVFADLSTDPARDMEFDVDRVISFEGETGPYVQYAHTRCQSILRKANLAGYKTDQTDPAAFSSELKRDEELTLIRSMARFSETLDRTLAQRNPSQLTTYLLDLTRDFGTFYRECKVMDSENEKLSQARLALVTAAMSVLSLSLDLLGIPKPEKM